jgi:phosphoribosylanthranilate isomerase
LFKTGPYFRLLLFRIKICGITSKDDALQAAAWGADALGLNFYSRSPRFLAVERAAEIAAAVRSQFPQVKLIGVFVNSSVEALLRIGDAVPLDAWQLHGDEAPELIRDLAVFAPPRPILRAFRCRGADLREVTDYLQQCQQLGSLPAAILLDAYAPGTYGGTGQVVDWNVVRSGRPELFNLPVILAGGLTPENVAAAIRTAQPDGVDVASGVESSPGQKDPAKVRAFIDAAK